MADYKSKKAGNRSARRPFIYTGRVTSLRTTPCRHRAEDKLLRPLEIRLGVEGVGVDAYLVARTPAAWKASECLVEDHLWRSSRARGGATVHVYIGHRSTPGYTIDRADDTNGPRRVVHPDRHGSRHESTPRFIKHRFLRALLLRFFSRSSSSSSSSQKISSLSSRFLASHGVAFDESREIVHRTTTLSRRRRRWSGYRPRRKEEEDGGEGGRKGWHELKIEIIEVTSKTREARG